MQYSSKYNTKDNDENNQAINTAGDCCSIDDDGLSVAIIAYRLNLSILEFGLP